jgi:hypothetical protein
MFPMPGVQQGQWWYQQYAAFHYGAVAARPREEDQAFNVELLP